MASPEVEKLRVVLDYVPCEACLQIPCDDQELYCSLCRRITRTIAHKQIVRRKVLVETPEPEPEIEPVAPIAATPPPVEPVPTPIRESERTEPLPAPASAAAEEGLGEVASEEGPPPVVTQEHIAPERREEPRTQAAEASADKEPVVEVAKPQKKEKPSKERLADVDEFFSVVRPADKPLTRKADYEPIGFEWELGDDKWADELLAQSKRPEDAPSPEALIKEDPLAELARRETESRPEGVVPDQFGETAPETTQEASPESAPEPADAFEIAEAEPEAPQASAETTWPEEREEAFEAVEDETVALPPESGPPPSAGPEESELEVLEEEEVLSELEVLGEEEPEEELEILGEEEPEPVPSPPVEPPRRWQADEAVESVEQESGTAEAPPESVEAADVEVAEAEIAEAQPFEDVVESEIAEAEIPEAEIAGAGIPEAEMVEAEIADDEAFEDVDESGVAEADVEASAVPAPEVGEPVGGSDVAEDVAPIEGPPGLAGETKPERPIRGNDLNVKEVAGIGPLYGVRLSKAGVADLSDLIDLDIEEFSQKTGISARLLSRWRGVADLALYAAIPIREAEILVRAGFVSTEQLALSDEAVVLEKVRRAARELEIAEEEIDLSEATVRSWIAAAQRA